MSILLSNWYKCLQFHFPLFTIWLKSSTPSLNRKLIFHNKIYQIYDVLINLNWSSNKSTTTCIAQNDFQTHVSHNKPTDGVETNEGETENARSLSISFSSFFHKIISVTLLTSRVPDVWRSDSVWRIIKKKHQVFLWLQEERLERRFYRPKNSFSSEKWKKNFCS